MEGFKLAAITDAEKPKLRRKNQTSTYKNNKKSQRTMKYGARAPDQGACLKGILRTMNMQGFILAAITDVGKAKLRRKC